MLATFSYATLPDNEFISSVSSPHFCIEEAYLKGKINADSNEDDIVVTPNFIAVIDGSTSKKDWKFLGKTSGQWAKVLLREVVEGFSPYIDAPAAVQNLTQAIANFYTEHHLWEYIDHNPLHRFTASIVIYCAELKEVWQIGDCPCVIGNTKHLNTKPIDLIMAHARVAYIQALLAKGYTEAQLLQNDKGREFIMPFLKLQAYLQNQVNCKFDLSYGVIDGYSVSPQHINIYKIGEEKQLILASDGYPKLASTLLKSEEYLNKILLHDPLCIRNYQATKGCYVHQHSFDDRAYIRISLNSNQFANYK